MENIIFNELMAREFDVDVGVVEYNHSDENGKKLLFYEMELTIKALIDKTENMGGMNDNNSLKLAL